MLIPQTVGRFINRKILRHFNLKLIQNRMVNPPNLWGEEFRALWLRYKDRTMVPVSGAFTLYNALEYIHAADLKGSIVECGVYKGGMMGLAAHFLMGRGATDRELYLFDTFAGMSEPTKVDANGDDGDSWLIATNMFNKQKRNGFVDWCYGPLEEVRDTLERSSYPKDKVNFIKGKVEDTLPNSDTGDIAILRLDTDWYESTKAELEYLYDRVVAGGIIIVDDFSAWQGARKAVDEFLSNLNLMPFKTYDYHYGAIAFQKA